MVGIVIVSHSDTLAYGVKEVAQMMAQTVNIIPAGGLNEGGLGTDFNKISNAISIADSGDGVVVFTDMGSAVMTADMAIDSSYGTKAKLADCPIVEGAVTAAVMSESGASLEEIIEEVKKVGTISKL